MATVDYRRAKNALEQLVEEVRKVCHTIMLMKNAKGEQIYRQSNNAPPVNRTLSDILPAYQTITRNAIASGDFVNHISIAIAARFVSTNGKRSMRKIEALFVVNEAYEKNNWK